MLKNEIAIKKLSGVVLDKGYFFTSFEESNIDKQFIIYTLQANIMKLGFILNKELIDSIFKMNKTKIIDFSKEIISILKKLKGDDVVYEPMYPNFPKQVMEASEFELFLNAIIHYWTCGEWKPTYTKEARKFDFENIKFREIKLLTEEEFNKIFTSILSSNESISDFDKKVIHWMIDKQNEDDLIYPKVIPYKENMCIIAGIMINKNKSIEKLVKTSTDLLRVITYLSDGDISLAKNTMFKSLKRHQRKYFVNLLEKIISEEDIHRHKNKWNRLFHNLHVGKYYNCKKVNTIAKKIRSNKKLSTTNSKVQKLINEENYVKASEILKNRPREFARKLDFLIRKEEYIANKFEILNNFKVSSEKISTRVLLQLLGHFKNRNKCKKRIIFPKGKLQKARIIEPIKEFITSDWIEIIYNLITDILQKRFKNLENLGNVYIDEDLKYCPLPTQQRSASNAMDVYARGTRIKIADDKNTIRLFVYWIGLDIDLSASFHNDNFKYINHVSYTRLKSKDLLACHSGDITRAPYGAAEFIDINIDKALKLGNRYVAMNVYVFRGPTFAEHKKCYVGWMTRSYPRSNEIFEPSTVENKINLCSDTRNSIPIIFDLKERKIIYSDLSTIKRDHHWGNNIESNKASSEQVIESMLTLDNKVNLYELFAIHASVRGNIVENKEDADIVFSFDGDITPKDINIINSEYII